MSTVTATGEPVDHKVRRRVWLAGGVGAAIGALIYEGLLGHDGILTSIRHFVFFGLATLPVLWISLTFLHPFYEAWQEGASAHRFTLGGIMLAVFIVGGCFESLLHHTFTAHSTAQAVTIWGTVAGGLLYGGLITRAWMKGMQARPQRADVRGLATGAVVGFVAPFMVIFLTTPRAQALGVPGLTRTAIGPALEQAFMWALVGFFGGALLMNGEASIRAGWRATLGSCIGVVVADITIVLLVPVWVMGSTLFQQGLRPLWETNWLVYGSHVLQELKPLAWDLVRQLLICMGWGGMLWVYRPSESVLAPVGTPSLYLESLQRGVEYLGSHAREILGILFWMWVLFRLGVFTKLAGWLGW